MASRESHRDFHHPYEPYDVQNDFMNAVYNCLEDGKVGIFESPTGTGKSLSLICSSLTWLRDHRRKNLEEGQAIILENGEDPDWVVEHARKLQRREVIHRRQELNDRIAKVKAKEKRIKERYESGEPPNKRRKPALGEQDDAEDEAQFALDDYESDNECSDSSRAFNFNESGLSAETQALMNQLGQDADAKDDNDDDAEETKIFFCSRTHSQLSQFASELRRVKMPPTISEPTSDDPDYDGSPIPLVEDVKYLTLGSRKNLCINSKVSKLSSTTAINERCVELQQSKTAEGKCPHMPTKETQALTNDFRDHALVRVRDIEDLGSLGKRLGLCPYYASRPATKHCEILSLPYPLLLQRSARAALGLSLKNHVIIIDEAHNLMDAIAGIYSISVTLDQVQQARTQLTVYLQKFRNKLKGKNRVYVSQILRILNSILTYMQSLHHDAKAVDGNVDMSSVMSNNGLDQINIFKLSAYIQESRLARKVDGYTIYTDLHKREQDQQSKIPPGSARQNVPVLMHVQSFLLSLMNPSAEGRFFYAKDDGSSTTLRYMLLDPTFHFRDIVEEARAVVLAGGTMSPMSDYEQHLLSYLAPEKIAKLSCGHVIPPSNLLAVPVAQSFNKQEFSFTFENRNKEKTIVELGQAILSFIARIPDGVVVFFPSYSYLDHCMATWKRIRPANSSKTYWDTFGAKKTIFCEQSSQKTDSAKGDPSTKSAAVDSVLASYSAAVASGNGRGALLFAVIGGSLSEGINFSDALGRGVVVVGLPFPNPHSAEWKAKMQYIAAKETQAGGDGQAKAKDFYENACMRAVNQSVGRAIRHKGDYAAILMLDKRYGTKRIQDKLPSWIRASLAKASDIREVEEGLERFFNNEN